MTNQLSSHTATRALLFVALLFAGSLAWAAQVAGTIAHLSGPLLAKKADGTVKVLALKSEFEEGDTLVSEKNTYVQLKFIDSSEMTMKPGTTLTIEKFAYDAGKPEADGAAFNLLKGGLRSVTGLLGKRNKERFALKTPAATIGIRGTTFIVEYVEPGPEAVAAMEAYLMASTAGLGDVMPKAPLQLAQAGPGIPPPPPAGGLPPGLYVQVIDGTINLSNRGGAQQFQAGQFGYTPNMNRPPVVVPPNPGLQFNPPPHFNPTPPGGPVTTGSGSRDGPVVDCIVR